MEQLGGEEGVLKHFTVNSTELIGKNLMVSKRQIIAT